MSETTNRFLVRIISAGLLLKSLLLLGGAMQSHGLGSLLYVVGALYFAVLARGLWKFGGRAWLLTTLTMLFGAVRNFVLMIVAYDHGDASDAKMHILLMVVLVVALRFLGRYEMEKRFRPHLAGLESEHAH